VPSLIVPRGLDQPDNAFRARRIGVARVLPRWRYSGARAASHLRALLDSPQYSVSAQATADRIRRENGIENACDAIEEVLRQPKLDARN
jgi:UDP:flavonoid glycosyltransferase YjiC (YdhE family)